MFLHHKQLRICLNDIGQGVTQ